MINLLFLRSFKKIGGGDENEDEDKDFDGDFCLTV